MNNRAYTILGAILVVGLMAVSTAQAQTTSQELRAKVPFAFSAGEETLPAGEYKIRILNSTAGGNILQLRSKDGHHFMVLAMTPASNHGRDDAKLVFNRYEDRCFLAQVRLTGENPWLQARKSRAERHASQIARSEWKTVAIALSPR